MWWERGRSGSYEKLRLLWWRFRRVGGDVYLLRFPPGGSAHWHYDRIENGRHYRLNIELRKPRVGGFETRERVFRLGRLAVFRPDRVLHRVSAVSDERLVLSFGLGVTDGH